MTPCAPNPISASDIQNEFGGSNPISLSEYYGVAAGVPGSGTISYDDLRCKTNLIYGTFYYNTPGTYYVTVPIGVASIGYMVQGAGGAGAAGNPFLQTVNNTFLYNAYPGCDVYGADQAYQAGGGGASGEMRSGTFATAAGRTLTIIVGAGGNVVNAPGPNYNTTGQYVTDDAYPDDLGAWLISTGNYASAYGGFSQFSDGFTGLSSYGGNGGDMRAVGAVNNTGLTGAVNPWGSAASGYQGGFGGPSYFGASGDWYYRYTLLGSETLINGVPGAVNIGAGGCGSTRIATNAGAMAQNGANGAVWFTWNSSFGYPAWYQTRYGQNGSQQVQTNIQYDVPPGCFFGGSGGVGG